jgi:hypothetical protein
MPDALRSNPGFGQPTHPQQISQQSGVDPVGFHPPVLKSSDPQRMRQIHAPTRLGDHIRSPIPTPRRLKDNLRIRTRLLDLETKRQRVVVDTFRPQFGAIRIQHHDHRPATVQIHTHVTCHSGPPCLDE